jgi:hypothetical protein
MFGTYRFGLAIMVLISHSPAWPDPIWHNASWALETVRAFYFFCLSEFVIAEALNDFYRDPVFRFAAKRFLKIYPAFWAVSLLTFVTFRIVGKPVTFSGPMLFANITQLGSFFKSGNKQLLITGGWARNRRANFLYPVCADLVAGARAAPVGHCLVVDRRAVPRTLCHRCHAWRLHRFLFQPAVCAAVCFGRESVLGAI